MKWIIWSLLFCSSYAFASNDGNRLLKNCNAALEYQDSKAQPDSFINVGHCIGYVTGIMDTIEMWNAVDKNGSMVCLPNGGISPEQGIRVVVKYLKDHPEKLHLASNGLVWEAFLKAFPCH
jgi:hypothetical protein